MTRPSQDIRVATPSEEGVARLAVFASGMGTNFEAIAAACAAGELPAEVVLVVCDKAGAGVVARAERRGIPCLVFAAKDYDSKAAYERELVHRLRETGVSLICLAGYMRLVGEELLEAYRGRIINIHPSLLPAFQGAHAIEQAFAYGVKVFGVTVHFVDESLDGGRIIAQRAFPYAGHDVAELERMIHAVEYPLYIEAIRKVISGL